MLKFVDHLLYKFMKWSLLLLLAVGAFVYYRLEINRLPEEEDERCGPRAAAGHCPSRRGRRPRRPTSERMRRNEAGSKRRLDEARFHSRRPPAARPARSAPAEPAAYEAAKGARPALPPDEALYVDSSSADRADDVPFDFLGCQLTEDDARRTIRDVCESAMPSPRVDGRHGPARTSGRTGTVGDDGGASEN